MRDKKSLVLATPYIITIIACLSFFAFLTTQFWALGDDIAFAKCMENGIPWQNMITANGVNGRYIGNTLGIVFAFLSKGSFWWIRALFNILCMVSLVVLVSKHSIRSNNQTFQMISVAGILFLTANEYAYVEFYSYSAGFMNYFVPSLLFVFDLFLFKKYLSNHRRIIAVFVCIISFINCFFVELITVYMVISAGAFVVYCFYKKTNKLFSIVLMLSSLLGLILMFSYGLVCMDNQSVYRSSFFEQGFSLIYNNILQYSYMMLFAHPILTLFLSSISILFVYSKWKKNKSNIEIPILVTFICIIGFVISLMLRYGNWKNTPFGFLVSNAGVSVLSIVYLINIGVVLFYKKEKEQGIDYALYYYFSIWILSGILSMVSPIGWRTFFIIYVLLVLIGLKMFALSFDSFNTFLIATFVISFFLLFCFHTYNVGKGFYNAHKVEMQRENYLEQQLRKHKEKVEVPDSVSFADAGSLRFLKDYYYYEKPGDIEIIFVPYDDWVVTKENRK